MDVRPHFGFDGISPSFMISKEQERPFFDLKRSHYYEPPQTMMTVPNHNKVLYNGGELKVELRTESGLMTGRRTLFFLEANWPTELLQQKETQDLRIFYYPGTRNIDFSPEDPSKLWLTEEFFPGTNVYLEVQFWTHTSDNKLQFIQRCNKHGNIVKVAESGDAKGKEISDNFVNWKGNSLPKMAICFCCTPSCFRKLDPLMFVRMRFGQMVYQSQWFQLVFRKSTKRKREKGMKDDLPNKSIRNEELAIRELSNFSGVPCPSIPVVSPALPKFNMQSPSPSIETPNLDPFWKLRFPVATSPILPTFMRSPAPKISNINNLLCSDEDIARSLLKLEENSQKSPPVSRESPSKHTNSKIKDDWEELERKIESSHKNGSSLCMELFRVLTLHEKDYDFAKESFIKWLKLDRGFSYDQTLELVLSVISKPYFHGQPNSEVIEKRLLQSEKRSYALTLNQHNPFLSLRIVGKSMVTITLVNIKFGNEGFSYTLEGQVSDTFKSLEDLMESLVGQSEYSALTRTRQ